MLFHDEREICQSSLTTETPQSFVPTKLDMLVSSDRFIDERRSVTQSTVILGAESDIPHAREFVCVVVDRYTANTCLAFEQEIRESTVLIRVSFQSMVEYFLQVLKEREATKVGSYRSKLSHLPVANLSFPSFTRPCSSMAFLVMKPVDSHSTGRDRCSDLIVVHL